MKIYASAENYLEAILELTKQYGQVRSVDVATHLGFSKPSVSVAMKQLRENGYISVEHDGSIELLEPGRAIAEKIYERHCVLTEMLVSLGVDRETALNDACKIEHDISEETFECIKKHFEQYKK